MKNNDSDVIAQEDGVCNRQSVLVGSTGFVGSNLLMQHAFLASAHGADVDSLYGSHPDLCVYAGVPSSMFLANNDPEGDLNIMKQARKNLRNIAPKKVVLISTIAVYSDSRNKTEACSIESDGNSAYGANRLQLEQWVREDFPDALIVRLPALYGKGLKKNFIKDMISIAPPLLSPSKYEELACVSNLIRRDYCLRDDGFYGLRGREPLRDLKEWFSEQDFNALSFTDSRSRFQFYDLTMLWSDISIALRDQRPLFNLATPPVTAADVYGYVRQKTWVNHLSDKPFDYDMKTEYGLEGTPYLCTLEEELSGIKAFVEAAS